jgi:DNA repair exonuclease SbcCD nuclease subunit
MGRIRPINFCKLIGEGEKKGRAMGFADKNRKAPKGLVDICILDIIGEATEEDPVTQEQIRDSGLDYLALGHIHKSGRLRFGETLCAWPGCPMGRGYDETGEKGVYIVTLDDTVEAVFRPLDTPRFYDLTVEAGVDPAETLNTNLPSVGSNDYYRVTLTGECPEVDLSALQEAFVRFPRLVLRDRTVPPVDLWVNAGDDTLEGAFFRLLQEALADEDPDAQRQIRLAAKLCRKLLDGQEVALP